jgi:hypothetical protein
MWKKHFNKMSDKNATGDDDVPGDVLDVLGEDVRVKQSDKTLLNGLLDHEEAIKILRNSCNFTPNKIA